MESVKYLELRVAIHGLGIKDKSSIGFLEEWIKETTKAGLLGHQKDVYNFRDEFESDIEVELVQYAGNFATEGK